MPTGALNLKQMVAREVESIEREALVEALSRTGYKKSQTARLLGVSRPTLDAKIEKYGLTKERILDEAS